MQLRHNGEGPGTGSMGASDVKADEQAKGEPGDGVPAPLSAAATPRSSLKPANGNGNRAKRNGNGNGNGAKRNGNGARRNGNGARSNGNGDGNGANGNGSHATDANANGASTAVSPALDRDELTALLETAQRTIPAPPAPDPDPLRADPAERFADLDDLPPDALEPRGPTRRGGRERLRRRARRDARADRVYLLDRPPPPRPLPADRRAKLLASLARSAEQMALAEEREPAPRPTPRPRSKTARRVLAVLALLAPPAAIAMMLTTHVPSGELSRADAAFVAGQLVAADQRLRAQLVSVPANGTAVAIARAREAELTTRSLVIEVRDHGGREAARLRRALRLEREWIAAVGSTLANPRSELRSALIARGAAAREALEALPGPSGKRLGGARSLVSYARSRVAATAP